MDITETLTTLGMILGSVGGLEGIKYFLNRDANKRIKEAEADTKKAEADHAQFDNFREYNEYLQDALQKKEERFQETITKQRELLDEVNTLTTKVAVLETERQMKMCEVRGCANRKPQSGY